MRQYDNQKSQLVIIVFQVLAMQLGSYGLSEQEDTGFILLKLKLIKSRGSILNILITKTNVTSSANRHVVYYLRGQLRNINMIAHVAN